MVNGPVVVIGSATLNAYKWCDRDATWWILSYHARMTDIIFSCYCFFSDCKFYAAINVPIAQWDFVVLNMKLLDV